MQGEPVRTHFHVWSKHGFLSFVTSIPFLLFFERNCSIWQRIRVSVGLWFMLACLRSQERREYLQEQFLQRSWFQVQSIPLLNPCLGCVTPNCIRKEHPIIDIKKPSLSVLVRLSTPSSVDPTHQRWGVMYGNVRSQIEVYHGIPNVINPSLDGV